MKYVKNLSRSMAFRMRMSNRTKAFKGNLDFDFALGEKHAMRLYIKSIGKSHLLK